MCPHLHHVEAELESAFTVDSSRVTFGAGALREVGHRVASHLAQERVQERAQDRAQHRAQGGRVALFTDARLRHTEWFDDALAALRRQNFEVVVFDAVLVEPTDVSIAEGVAFARDTRADAFVSLGGGSVIDTAKLANLLATHPGELVDYVNAPIGGGRPVPGPLKPHIACPTTSGTGSEVTGIAIFDMLSAHAKTGVSSPRLRPTEAVVDPRTTATLPAGVVASSGLDVLCHAIESLTARPFTRRTVSVPATSRPASQGANPWSDLGARQAIELIARYLRRAVSDARDDEARHQMMWAATLAGIAFGNAGVHVPHAMAYAVAGRLHDVGGEYRPAGYPPDVPLVPHGFAVAVNAPAAFRALAPTAPFRHLEAARLLGGEVAGVGPIEAGDVLAEAFAGLMHDVGAPNGIGGVGYTLDDVPALVKGAAAQRRLLDNAPSPVGEAELDAIFRAALRCW